MIPDVSSAEIFKVFGDPFGYSVMLTRKKRMGLDPKSTEKEKVNVWMVVALMIGVVGLLGGPEKEEIGNMLFITAGKIVMNLLTPVGLFD